MFLVVYVYILLFFFCICPKVGFIICPPIYETLWALKWNQHLYLMFFYMMRWIMPPKPQYVPVSWCLSDLPETNLQKGYNLNVTSNSQLLALKEFPDVSTNIWFEISMKRLFKYQLQAAKKRQQTKQSTPLKFQLKSSFLVSMWNLHKLASSCTFTRNNSPKQKHMKPIVTVSKKSPVITGLTGRHKGHYGCGSGCHGSLSWTWHTWHGNPGGFTGPCAVQGRSTSCWGYGPPSQWYLLLLGLMTIPLKLGKQPQFGSVIYVLYVQYH